MSKRSSKFPGNSFFRRQGGASLLEAISFLGIAALVILGAVSLLSSAYSSGQTNKTMDEVVGIRTSTNRLFMAQSASYGNADLNPTLISAHAIPSTVTVGDTNTLFNSWNGAVSITGAGNAFTIEYDAVPKDVCISLLTASVGFQSIKVGNANTQTSFPISPASATTDCSGTTNKIVWTAT